MGDNVSSRYTKHNVLPCEAAGSDQVRSGYKYTPRLRAAIAMLRSQYGDSLAILLLTSLAYVMLLSRQYIGDGIRWLPSVTSPDLPHSGGTNHLLFPYLFWLIYHGTKIIGVSNPPVLLLQSANAVFGAIGLSLLYLFLRASQIRRQAAIVGVILVGTSQAYLLHATDMTEPMPSVMPMLGGLLLVRLRWRSSPARCIGAACIGLAGAVYQTALFALVPASMIAGAGQWQESVSIRQQLRRICGAMLQIISTGAAVFAVLVVLVTVWSPSAETGSGVSAVIALPGSGVHGRLDPRQLVGGMFGFANALAPLRDWAGASRLFSAGLFSAVYNLGLLSLALGFGLLLAFCLFAQRKAIARQRLWGDILGASCWLALVYLVASYWAGTYEKLWIGGVLAISILVAHALEGYNVGSGIPRRTRDNALLAVQKALVGLVAVFAVLSLITGAVPRRLDTNYDLVAAQRITQLASAQDLLVCSGWENPCMYPSLLLSSPTPVFVLAGEAIAAGFSAEEVSRRLQAAIVQTTARGGRVLFIGTLDMSRAEWSPWLGQRFRLPYDLLAPYRSRALVLERINRGPHGSLTVWQLGPPQTGTSSSQI